MLPFAAEMFTKLTDKMTTKPRVVKDYDKLDESVLQQIKLSYPRGFDKHLVKFKNAKGDNVSALPFETDDRYYLVRMTVQEARDIISDDDDYNDDGILRADIREDYADKLENEFAEEGMGVMDDEEADDFSGGNEEEEDDDDF